MDEQPSFTWRQDLTLVGAIATLALATGANLQKLSTIERLLTAYEQTAKDLWAEVRKHDTALATGAQRNADLERRMGVLEQQQGGRPR